MRPSPEIIRLGAQEWLVRPLTLRQVEEIEPILVPNPAEPRGNVASAMAIVAVALKRDYPDAAASLAEVEATAQEISAAMAKVLRLGGFIEVPKDGDSVPGEAPAGRVHATDLPASISATFTRD
jgi:hypothetical protein